MPMAAKRGRPRVGVVRITRLDEDGIAWGQPHDAAAPPLRLRNSAHYGTIALGARALVKHERNHEGQILRLFAPQSDHPPFLAVVRRQGRHLVGESVARGMKRVYAVAPPDGGAGAAADVTWPQLAWLVSDGLAARHRGSAQIRRLIGPADDADALARLSLAEAGLDTERTTDWSPAVRQEVAALDTEAARTGRRAVPRTNLCQLPFVTIDPADARDHDDAVCAQPLPDGGARLWVAIADVAAFVPAGSALDEAARARGQSVYLPNGVIPMLPPRLSHDLCSLKPHTERLALVADLRLDARGRVTQTRFQRATIRSIARLTYRDAQRAAESKEQRAADSKAPSDAQPATAQPATAQPSAAQLSDALSHLWHAYRLAASAREARQPLDLNLPEIRVQLDADGAVCGLDTPPRLEAHRLIEEFMILANQAAAKTLAEKRCALLYRVHARPDADKWPLLAAVTKQFGVQLPSAAAVRPADFNRFLARARAAEQEALLSDVILRCQAQAVYAPANIGHYGLALDAYTHFTSPIRRYSDLLVHRALIAALSLGGSEQPEEADALGELGEALSRSERTAMVAERQCRARYAAQWARRYIGQTMTGRIAGLARGGLFVRMDELPLDGFLPMRRLPGGPFRLGENGLALVARRGRRQQSFRLGQPLSVELTEADALSGSCLLALAA